MRVATRRPLLATAALAALAALGACVGDGDVLNPAVDPAAGSLFVRYVSLGNSITAGFQSAGIVDSTQRNAYPNLLARAAGGIPFQQPMFARPGCPPLMTAPLTPCRSTCHSCARRFGPKGRPRPMPFSSGREPGTSCVSSPVPSIPGCCVTTRYSTR